MTNQQELRERIAELEKARFHWRQDALARLEVYLIALRSRRSVYGSKAHIRANLIAPTIAMLGDDTSGEYEVYDEQGEVIPACRMDEPAIMQRAKAAIGYGGGNE